jgi:polysaccharide chain length determinant protein (PEP-CTERM system associated)
VTSEFETRIHTLSQQILSRARLEELIRLFDLYPDLRKRVPADALAEHMRADIRFDLTEGQSSSSLAPFPTTAPGQSVTVGFRVSYLGLEPQTVARVTNTLASFYVDESSKARGEQASGTAQFLQTEVNQMKERLEHQAARLNDYKDRYMSELPELVEANLWALQRLNGQLQQNGESRRRGLERREALSRQLAEETVAPSSEARNPTAARLLELQRRLAELGSRVTEKHPELVRIRSEIATLEARLVATEADEAPSGGNGAAHPPEQVVKRLRQAIGEVDRQAIQQIDTELQSLKREDERVREAIVTYERRIENAPKRKQEFEELSREYEATKELYQSLLKRYEDAHLTESMEEHRAGERFQMLDPALPPRAPVAPNRRMLLVMGFALALIVAAMAVVVAERVEASFHSVDGLRAFTRVPVVASISSIITPADTRRARWRLGLGVLGAACGLVLIVAVSWHFAQGNEQLVRTLARGRL